MAKNTIHIENSNYFPQNYPLYMSGKLTYKVKIKDDFIRKDNTCAIYIQIFLNGKKKILPLGFSVELKYFDKQKQRLKSSFIQFKDYNLLIEKKLSDINKIEVNFRLANKPLEINSLISELENPSANIDFIKFWEFEMIRQKEILKTSTYNQQISVLKKVSDFKNPLFFYEITPEYIQDFKAHCKKLGNNPNTIFGAIKSFKKYLHIANDKGITTPLMFNKLVVKHYKGNRVYLSSDEVAKLYEYWNTEFCNESHKSILGMFLFSCFTGLRISDVKKITEENFIENTLVFTSEKTGKFQRIPLNESAKKISIQKEIFAKNFSEQFINRELKDICKFLNIPKNISYHVSRHTFATNFIFCGGNVVNLQKLLGHSNINETMIYVKIVDQLTELSILNMDQILEKKPVE